MHLKYIIIVFFPSNNWYPQQIALRRDFLWPSWTLSNIFFLPSSPSFLLYWAFTSPALFCCGHMVGSVCLHFPCWTFRQNNLPSLSVLSSVMLNPMNDLLLFTPKIDTFWCNFAWHMYSLWRTRKLKSDFLLFHKLHRTVFLSLFTCATIT